MMVRAWEVRNLTPSERLVLLALADCADREGRNAFRSESTIADHTQLGLRTVKRAIANLKTKRLIEVQELPVQRRSTTYSLFPAGPDRGEGRPVEHESRGANLAPLQNRLGVPLGVPNVTLRGAKSNIPYKDDPVFDPVEPHARAAGGAIPHADGQAERWRNAIRTLVHQHLREDPTAGGIELLDAIAAECASVGIPRDDGLIGEAIEQALSERRLLASHRRPYQRGRRSA